MARRQNNTVYFIDFEDGSIYVGSTKYYKNRIRRHMYALNVEQDKRPLYEKMRNGLNYSFHIHRNNIETEEEMRELEKKLIKIHVKMGYEVLNIKDIELEKNPTPKELIHETKQVSRKRFHIFCNTWGLNFDDFVEVWRGYRDEFLVKKFNYIHKDRVPFVDMTEVEFIDSRVGNTSRRNAVMPDYSKAKMSDSKFYPIEYYETHPTTMRLFKTTLEKRGMKLKDFTWEDTDMRTNKGEVKKLFKRIDNVVR